jgi:cell division septal protein FtsQ
VLLLNPGSRHYLTDKCAQRLQQCLDKLWQQKCGQVQFIGIKFTDQANLQRHIDAYCDGSIGEFVKLHQLLQENPWIRNLQLSRQFPGVLRVKVIEYNPFALFTSDNQEYLLVDEYGHTIDVPKEQLVNFSHLFTIVDKNIDATEINRLFNILTAHDNLIKNISSFLRVGNRRWNLLLKNNLLVKLPMENDTMIEALVVLDILLDTPGLQLDLREIDLRLSNRAFLGYTEKVLEELKNFSTRFP